MRAAAHGVGGKEAHVHADLERPHRRTLDEARRAGAIGGKVTGAGGGGYVLLYCRYDRRHGWPTA